MNCWQRLAIKPTSDLRAIKKAYAIQLKLIDQETEADAFIALREALQQAQFQAEYLDDSDHDHAESEDLEKQVGTDQDQQNNGVITTCANAASDLDQPILSIFDLKLAIENHYQTLQQQIENQDIHLNLRDALFQLKRQIEQLDDIDQAEHIEKITTLLDEHGLDSLSPWLEGYAENNFYNLDVAGYGFEYIEKPQLIDSVLYKRSQKIAVYLEKKDLRNEVYFMLKDLFIDLEFVSDEEKKLIQLKLIVPFSASYRDHNKEQFNQFSQLWLNTFPLSVNKDNNTIKFYQDKILKYLNRYQELLKIEALQSDNREIFEKLRHGETLTIKEILKLKQHLKNTNPTSDLNEIYSLLNIQSDKSKLNWWKLKNYLEYKNYIWIAVILSLCNTYFLTFYISDAYIAIPLALVFSFSYFLVIQTPLSIKLTSHLPKEKHHNILIRLWFFSAIILIPLITFIPEQLHQALTYIWVLSTGLLWGVLQLKSQNDFLLIFTVANNKTEKISLLLTLILFSFILIKMYFELSQNSQQWLIFYSLIPISFIISPVKFYTLFDFFKFKGKDQVLNYYRADWLNIRSTITIFSIFIFPLFTIQFLKINQGLQHSLFIDLFNILAILLLLLGSKSILETLKVYSHLITTFTLILFPVLLFTIYQDYIQH